MAVVAATAITTAVTGVASTSVSAGVAFASDITVQFDFVYGSTGTSGTVWLQTSFDGTVWFDIASMTFTTANKTRLLSLSASTVATTAITPADGALAGDTAISGFLGTAYRTKLTTVGTYAATTITTQVFPGT